MKLRNGRALGAAGVPVEALKCLCKDREGLRLIGDILRRMWTTGASYSGEHSVPDGVKQPPPHPDLPRCTHCEDPAEEGACKAPTNDDGGKKYKEWNTDVCVPVHKKGTTRLVKNWRTICIPDILNTVLSTVMAGRITAWAEKAQPETQNGFRPRRGTTDCLWNVGEVLRQRRAEGLTTWAVFVDIKAAFDTVSREALYHIMLRLGFPAHFVNVLRRLNRNIRFEVTIGGKKYYIYNRAGVRAGDTAGPSLFNLCMMALMELMTWPAGGIPLMKTTQHLAHKELRAFAATEGFEVPSSEYADDCGLLFVSRAAMILGTGAFARTMTEATGMHVHYGATATDKSKTVAMCFPAPPRKLDEMDTTTFRIQCDGGTYGYIHFAERVRYLGSTVHYDLASNAAAEARIQLAERALEAQRRVLQCRWMDAVVRGAVLRATVLPTLLYGSETWVITKTLRTRLEVCWNDCCRYTMRTSRVGAALDGLSRKEMYSSLGVEGLSYYLRHRRLRWAGDLARMPMYRLPRKLLTSWPTEDDANKRKANDNGGGGRDGGDSNDMDDEVEEADKDTMETDEGEDGEEEGRGEGGDGDDDEPDGDGAGDDGGEDTKSGQGVGQITGSDTEEERQHADDHSSTETDEEDDPDVQDDGQQYSVGRATGRARCARTRTPIHKGDISITRTIPARRQGGRPVHRHYSLAGAKWLVMNNERARLSMRRRLVEREPLQADERRAVKLTLQRQRENVIMEPKDTPWECNRCGKRYERRLRFARRHWDGNNCRSKAARITAAPKAKRLAPAVTGRRRKMTWLKSIHDELRGTTDVTTTPCPTCHVCGRNRKQCERCFFLEWTKRAHDPEQWDELVYENHNDEGDRGEASAFTAAATRRRQRRQTPAEEPYVDPRPVEARELDRMLDEELRTRRLGKRWTTLELRGMATSATAWTPPSSANLQQALWKGRQYAERARDKQLRLATDYAVAAGAYLGATRRQEDNEEAIKWLQNTSTPVPGAARILRGVETAERR